MPCLITMRSALKRLREKNNKSKNKNFTAKTQYLNLKATSDNVNLQSNKTLTTQILFFLTTHQMGFSLNATR